MRKSLPPSCILACAPLLVLYVAPNVQAHLSAFSCPLWSYQALRSGSVTASSNSWAIMLAMPSAPALPLGLLGNWAEQALGQRSGLPMNAYLLSDPPIVPCVCQPQYWWQKPEVLLTSAEVRTKYTPLVSFGRPLALA